MKELIFLAGSFDPLLQLFRPLVNDFIVFLQTMAVIVATAMCMFWKVRQMMANSQEDQMFDKKSRDALVACAFIFIVPTILKVISSYLL